jgi:hypothetical protein
MRKNGEWLNGNVTKATDGVHWRRATWKRADAGFAECVRGNVGP